MNEVPLVVGVKQSAGDLKLFADLMMMAPDKLIYSAGRRADVSVLRARRAWIDCGDPEAPRHALPSNSGTRSRRATMFARWSCTKNC